ncbi:MAG: helix-turn-helix domain-containing protein [Acidimicrobiia bacterium]
MSDGADLGRRIRESRLKQGMSLSQLAAEVGRSSSSVRRWERGEVPPAKAVMPALAQALDVDAEELESLRPSTATAVSEAASDEMEPSEGTDGPSTLEQPAVPADVSPVASDDSPSPQASQRKGGLLSELRDAWRALTSDWSGWIRGVATAGVLLVMLLILAWAVGELFGAIGEVWDSFDAESG